MPEKPAEGNVVALSPYRAQVARARRVRGADALWQAPDPEQAIKALPGDEFYYVLHEQGFPDALEIMIHGTAEQLRTALDFAIWDRDQVTAEQSTEWLMAMADAPLPVFGRWLAGLDVELLALLLRTRARIYDLSLGELPDDLDGTPVTSPDGLFAFEFLGGEDDLRLGSRILDALYEHDRNWARHLIVGAGGEFNAELEETAFRWRSGRMADLGFEDYYDALAIYRDIDPNSVRAGAPLPALSGATVTDAETLRIPGALAERLTGPGPFARAIAGVTARDELTALHAALVLLSNRALSADRVRPGDDPAVTSVLARVACNLDVAVEFLARDDPDRATAVVRSVPLPRLFQVGHTLAAKVKKLALTLRRHGPFATLLPRIDLLDAEDAEIFAALTLLRPMFPGLLDRPPSPGHRPFASLLDLAAATAAVERAGAAQALLLGLGVKPSDLAPAVLEAAGVTDLAAIDAATVARTALGRAALELPAPFRPLAAPEVAAWHRLIGDAAPAPPGRFQERLAAILTAAGNTAAFPGSPAALAQVQARWLAELTPPHPVLTAARPQHPTPGRRGSARPGSNH